MQQRIIINKGKKYRVNVVGNDDGVGSATQPGTLWMKSTDGLWYAVTLSGSSASAALVVNQTPLNWVSPGGQDFGYQLVYNYADGKAYQVFLSGSAGGVAVSASLTPWSNPTDYKPYLFLKSTDGYFYRVGINSGSISLVVNQNSKTLLYPPSPSYV